MPYVPTGSPYTYLVVSSTGRGSHLKNIHQEWPNESYKSFTPFIHGKLEKICAACAIDGARNLGMQLEDQGTFFFGWLLIHCGTNSPPFNFSWLCSEQVWWLQRLGHIKQIHCVLRHWERRHWIDDLGQNTFANMPISSKKTLKKGFSAKKPSSNIDGLMDDIANLADQTAEYLTLNKENFLPCSGIRKSVQFTLSKQSL